MPLSLDPPIRFVATSGKSAPLTLLRLRSDYLFPSAVDRAFTFGSDFSNADHVDGSRRGESLQLTSVIMTELAKRIESADAARALT